MIFLTVGTQFPFDRLVESVDRIASKDCLNEKIFAQIGRSCYLPKNFNAVSSMEKNIFDNYIRRADRIISHAGMGTITIALSLNKPLLVVPRRKKYREVVNDHQIAIAARFEQLKLILVAYDTSQIPDKLQQLKTFVPRNRQAHPEIIAQHIKRFLNESTKTHAE